MQGDTYAEQKTLGIVLGYYRTKKGYSMEKVCGGLCAVSTFFRIEQGERIADSLLSSLLLERIGCEITQFELLLDEGDYKRWSMREKINKLITEKKCKEAENALYEYRNVMESDSALEKQFCLLCEMKILLRYYLLKPDEKCREKLCQTAKQGLALTKENVKINLFLEDELYTQTELEFVLLLLKYEGESLWSEKQYEATMQKILQYVREQFVGENRIKICLEILQRLVWLTGKKGNTKAKYDI